MIQATNERARDDSRSSLQRGEPPNPDRPKVLLVVGDGAEVMDTLYPFFRLGEDYRVVVAAPQRRGYHLVIHELADGWDITQERAGYHLESEVAFKEVRAEDYVALVLPGGRAPEYLRYDADLMRITRDFFAAQKPVASICHGLRFWRPPTCFAAGRSRPFPSAASMPRCAARSMWMSRWSATTT